MTEETTVGGAEAASEGVPTPTFAEPSRDSATSTVDLEAVAQRVAERLLPEFDKRLQSTKDKRIAQIEKRLGLDELQELGVQLSPEQKMELRLRAIEENRTPQEIKPSGKVAEVSTTDWSKVIEETGLDMKQPEVIAFLRGEYRNMDHFTAEAYRLKSKLASSPNPTSANTSSLKSDKVPSTDINALNSEWADLSKNPTQNWKRMQEIREVLDKELR